jgi:integrase
VTYCTSTASAALFVQPLFIKSLLFEQLLRARGAQIMAKPNLRLVTPSTENRTVTPTRPTNADLRTREHLTADEVDQLIEAAKANRHGHRDGLMVLLAYRHGFRAAKVVDLRWEQVDFKTAMLHVRRVALRPRIL